MDDQYPCATQPVVRDALLERGRGRRCFSHGELRARRCTSSLVSQQMAGALSERAHLRKSCKTNYQVTRNNNKEHGGLHGCTDAFHPQLTTKTKTDLLFVRLFFVQ